MVILNTVSDADVHSVPQFIRKKLSSLLSVYGSDSLIDYGSVIIIETEEELPYINISAIEFTEKILCDDSVCWHLTIPRNNNFCEEIFVDEALMNEELIEACEANKERTVHDYEL